MKKRGVTNIGSKKLTAQQRRTEEQKERDFWLQYDWDRRNHGPAEQAGRKMPLFDEDDK